MFTEDPILVSIPAAALIAMRAELEHAKTSLALARAQGVVVPSADAAATARYEPYGPEGTMDGNPDDVWSAGQDSGEADLAAEAFEALANVGPEAAEIATLDRHAMWDAAYRQGAEDYRTDNAALSLLLVWAEAYMQGIQDEITSQSNPGIAGCFCQTPSNCQCFIAPARVNPFPNPQESL